MKRRRRRGRGEKDGGKGLGVNGGGKGLGVKRMREGVGGETEEGRVWE